jgi:3-isopropylmalate/(R)-2-methylmalate dehydratase small subunit
MSERPTNPPQAVHGETSAAHRVWRVGADIDTDALAPGAYMKFGIDEIARHCLEIARPDFAASVQPGDVLVAGPNFGIGSSREQAAAALVRLGVRAVIAPAFNGLYFRNAFNVGLLLLTCADAGSIDEGEHIAIDPRAGRIRRADGVELTCEPVPAFLLDMVEAGGLLNLLKQRYPTSNGVTSC